MPKLTAKQLLFVQEYIIDLNATQAAIRAGYSEKTAYSIGQRLLKKVEIQGLIQEAMDDRSKRTEITQDNVLNEIAKLAFGNIKNLYDEEGRLKDIKDIETDVAVTIQEITEDKIDKIVTRRKYKLADKKGNLELLGRHLKLFTDKIELGIKPTVIIKDLSGK